MDPTSLVDATQVCSAYCNVGRHLEEWELYAFLAFFWDREITIGDLDLSEDEASLLRDVLASHPKSNGQGQGTDHLQICTTGRIYQSRNTSENRDHIGRCPDPDL